MLDTRPNKLFVAEPPVPVWRPSEPGAPPCGIHPETPGRAGRVTTPDGDLRFLNVRGSSADMARQLGTRMTREIHQGPVPFFSTYLERVLRNSPVGKLSGALRWGTHQWITRRLESNMPADFRQAVEALSAAADVRAETLFKAYLMPETFLWIVGTFHRLVGTGRALGLGHVPTLGCTSAVLSMGPDQAPIHGRNFDYFGINYWDRFATVVFYHPDDGLDYVSVSSAGIIGGGITAMNAAGITLAVHQHVVDEFDLDGIPIGYAGDQVMRRAHSIEEAVAILRTYPPVAGWTYVLTEGDSGRVAIYEISPGHEALHWPCRSQPATGYANAYWAPELKDAEVDYYPEYRRCNFARQRRVLTCLGDYVAERAAAATEGASDHADVVAIARILGDMTDPDGGDERLFGPTISAAHTVASVIFEPRERRVWVAAGASPTGRRWMVPFRLGLQTGDVDGGPDTRVLPFHPFPQWSQSSHGRAFELYREASYRFWEGESNEHLLILIEHALALYPTEPNLHVLAGLHALRLGRAKRAEGAFRRAMEMIANSARRAEIGLFLGWALDLQGQRQAARHLYQKVRHDPDAGETTRSRAGHGRWIPFTRAQAAALAIDFHYAGVP